MVTPPNPAQFTGVPFVMGSIYGERCFDVRQDGLLMSPQKPYVWGPGENVAECKKIGQTRAKYDLTDMNRALEKIWPDRITLGISANPEAPTTLKVHWKSKTARRVVVWDPEVEKTAEGADKPEAYLGEVEVYPEDTETVEASKLVEIMESDGFYDHDFAYCVCGFYAYLTGAGYYYGRDRVIAIIEGYGETLIGEKGFRSTKAKILALAPCPEPEWADEEDVINGMISAMTSAISGTMPPTPPAVIQANALQVQQIALINVGGGGGGGGGGGYSTGVGSAQPGGSGNAGNSGVLIIPARMAGKSQAQAAAVQAAGAQWKNVHVVGSGGQGAVASEKSKVKPRKIKWKNVKKKYPDAVIFKSAEKMFKQFPVTPLEEVL